MTSRDFCLWLQGAFELGQPRAFDEVRTEQIRKHLALVFKHEIDPSAGPPEHQVELNAIHDAIKKHEADRPHVSHIPHSDPFGPTIRC